MSGALEDEETPFSPGFDDDLDAMALDPDDDSIQFSDEPVDSAELPSSPADALENEADDQQDPLTFAEPATISSEDAAAPLADSKLDDEMAPFSLDEPLAIEGDDSLDVTALWDNQPVAEQAEEPVSLDVTEPVDQGDAEPLAELNLDDDAEAAVKFHLDDEEAPISLDEPGADEADDSLDVTALWDNQPVAEQAEEPVSLDVTEPVDQGDAEPLAELNLDENDSQTWSLDEPELLDFALDDQQAADPVIEFTDESSVDVQDSQPAATSLMDEAEELSLEELDINSSSPLASFGESQDPSSQPDQPESTLSLDESFMEAELDNLTFEDQESASAESIEFAPFEEEQASSSPPVETPGSDVPVFDLGDADELDLTESSIEPEWETLEPLASSASEAPLEPAPPETPTKRGGWFSRGEKSDKSPVTDATQKSSQPKPQATSAKPVGGPSEKGRRLEKRRTPRPRPT